MTIRHYFQIEWHPAYLGDTDPHIETITLPDYVQGDYYNAALSYFIAGPRWAEFIDDFETIPALNFDGVSIFTITYQWATAPGHGSSGQPFSYLNLVFTDEPCPSPLGLNVSAV